MDSRQITRLTRRSVRVRDTRKTLAVVPADAGTHAAPATGAPLYGDGPWPWRTARRRYRARMVRWRAAVVTAVRRRWPGAVELETVLADGSPMRALAYPRLVGDPGPGDRVLLNAGALLMGLGTGGYALVVALPDRLPPDPVEAVDTRDAGHLVKARYTPLQPILLGVDEEASPHRAVLAARRVARRDAGGHRRPALGAAGDPRRGARRPAGHPGGVPDDRRRRAARLVLPDPRRAGRAAGRDGHRRPGLRRRPGGDQRAQRSARRPARPARRRRRRGAGPRQPRHRHHLGLLRRGGRRGDQRRRTPSAAAPVGSLRISGGGPATAAPRRVAPQPAPRTAGWRSSPADLVVPAGLDAELAAEVARGTGGAGRTAPDRHRRQRTGWTPPCALRPVPLSTMGRGLDADHAYFLAAAAAGRHAARLGVQGPPAG